MCADSHLRHRPRLCDRDVHAVFRNDVKTARDLGVAVALVMHWTRMDLQNTNIIRAGLQMSVNEQSFVSVSVQTETAMSPGRYPTNVFYK